MRSQVTLIRDEGVRTSGCILGRPHSPRARRVRSTCGPHQRAERPATIENTLASVACVSGSTWVGRAFLPLLRVPPSLAFTFTLRISPLWSAKMCTPQFKPSVTTASGACDPVVDVETGLSFQSVCRNFRSMAGYPQVYPA